MHCEIVGVVRSLERATRRFQGVRKGNPLRFVEATVGFGPRIPLPATDFLIHAASNATRNTHQSAAIETLAANLGGLHNAMGSGVVRANSRVLFLSSAEVYGRGELRGRGAIREDDFAGLDAMQPRAAYAISKLATEMLAAAYCREQNACITIARPFHCYGPGMRLTDGRAFSDFVAAAAQSADLVIQGDGTPIRAYCYITDATAAFFTILLKGEPAQAYNVGNPSQVFSVRQLAGIVQNLQPRCGVRFATAGPALARAAPDPRDSYVPDITKVRRLGWQPSVTAEDGLERTIRYYRHCGS